MSIVFARPLTEHVNVEHFLIDCLDIDPDGQWIKQHATNFDALVKMIRDAEAANSVMKGLPTISHKDNRVRKYREDSDRKKLRAEILEELVKFDRLEDDDKIERGQGGSKPIGVVPAAKKQAYFIVGLPASGKSYLVSQTADKLGAMILDSDFAKRKLPEFDGSFAGANLVHKESSLIVLGGGKEASLLGYCIQSDFNVVIPTVGSNFEDIRTDAQEFKSKGYSVHLSATVLDRKEATKRAVARFLKTERYVPLGLIFDGYANDPLLHYYRQRAQHDAERFWNSLGSVCTGGGNEGVIEFTDEVNPISLLKKEVIQ